MNLVSRVRRGVAASIAVTLLMAGAIALGVSPASAVTPPCGQTAGQAMCLTIHVSSLSGTDADVTLPLSGMTDVSVDWGDSVVVGPLQGTDVASHSYVSLGDFTIKISGTSLTQFGNFDSTWVGADKLTGVSSWGGLGLMLLDSAFRGATSLTSVPVTLPSTVVSLFDTFDGATSFNGDITGWNTTNITTMSSIFTNATSFNRSLAAWHVQSDLTISLNGSGMSPANYSASLQGWANQSPIATGVTLSGGPSYLHSANIARQTLIGGGWTITDAGASCGEAAGQAMCLTMHITSLAGIDADVTVPVGGTMSNVYVDWGDGTPQAGPLQTNATHPSHTYLATGDYTVAIWGDHLDNFGDHDTTWRGVRNLTAVMSWGDLGLTKLDSAFADAVQLTSVPATLPNTVVSLYDLFDSATVFNGDLSGWNTSNVTNTAYMFSNAYEQTPTAFNGDISGWNTGSLTTAYYMFNGAVAFNQDISSWNVSNTNDMTFMFAGAASFNRSLAKWTLKTGARLDEALQGSGMSAANYSATLQGWAAQSPGATGVTLTGGPMYLPSAVAARQTLVGRGWDIRDAGLDTTGVVAPSVARSVVGSPGKKAVAISWLPPLSDGGLPITGYAVTATPSGATCTATSAQRSCIISGLTNGKAYTFKVTATNGGSKSSTTAASLAVYAGAPTAVQTLAVTFPATPHSAKVTWLAPKYINSGAVTGYRVRWCKVNTCSAWSNLAATARSATTTGRVKNVSYRVEVQAKNVFGFGPTASKTFKQAK